MENATKALIMAGTVLISILLISFLVLFLRKGASATAEYHSALSDAELAKFNAKFEVYDRRDNSYFDVITVANMVYDIDKANEYDTINQISLYVYDGSKNYMIHGGFLRPGEFGPPPYTNIYSLVSYYAETIERGTGNKSQKYKYLFKCSNQDGNGPGISYNEKTGKVNKIEFVVYKNE